MQGIALLKCFNNNQLNLKFTWVFNLRIQRLGENYLTADVF